jgi:hypothetical protein
VQKSGGWRLWVELGLERRRATWIELRFRCYRTLISANYTDMIYAKTAKEIEARPAPSCAGGG